MQCNVSLLPVISGLLLGFSAVIKLHGITLRMCGLLWLNYTYTRLLTMDDELSAFGKTLRDFKPKTLATHRHGW